MSRHAGGSGQGSAWLVADQDDGDHISYWYTDKRGDRLAEQTRATTATLAVGWARVRPSQATISLPDHRTYWTGNAPTPPGIAVDGPTMATHVLREERV